MCIHVCAPLRTTHRKMKFSEKYILILEDCVVYLHIFWLFFVYTLILQKLL